MPKKLLPYEKKQVEEIKKWKEEKPGLFTVAFGIAADPVLKIFQKAIPKATIEASLDLANTLAKKLTDQKDILTEGNVDKISDLRNMDFALSDQLANKVHNWAIGIAAAEGAAAGVGGIFALPIDIPFLITMALRTAYKIGLCYGYECESDDDKNFILGILAASGANSVEEKIAALGTLRAIEVALVKSPWKALAEKAAENQMGKEAFIIAIKNIGKQLGINITKRKILSAIPVAGAAIGGTVNGWYIKDVAWAARRAFQERWLTDNKKVLEI